MKIFIPEKAMSMEEMMPYIREAIVNIALEIDKINESINALSNTSTSNIDKKFYQELVDLKGIGKETADDIVAIYPNKELLTQDIKKKKKMPFRNDIVKLLEKKYAKQ